MLVAGRIGIMVDDIIDTCGTMIKGIDELDKHGIKGVILLATHGIFSGSALERINKCDKIIKVIITNSISQEYNIQKCPKIRVVDLEPLLSDVLRRLVTGESISELFD